MYVIIYGEWCEKVNPLKKRPAYVWSPESIPAFSGWEVGMTPARVIAASYTESPIKLIQTSDKTGQSWEQTSPSALPPAASLNIKQLLARPEQTRGFELLNVSQPSPIN